MIWVAYALVVLTALLTLGTIAWQTPWIGFIGSLGGYLPGWLISFAAAGGVAGLTAWLLAPSSGGLVVAVLSLAMLPVGVKVIRDQRRVLKAAGVKVRARDFFGPGAGAKTGPDEVVTYGPIDGYSPKMGIYRPEQGLEPHHVVVHIHGGGWSAGDEASDSSLMRELAKRGYLVFTPSYTYATATRPTWELAPRQIAGALVEVRRIAPRYGVRADCVYLMGSSAGGQLAPLVANRLAAGELLGQEDLSLPEVAALVLLIPAVDPAMAEGNRYVPAGATGRRLVRELIGGSARRISGAVRSRECYGASRPQLTAHSPGLWPK